MNKIKCPICNAFGKYDEYNFDQFALHVVDNHSNVVAETFVRLIFKIHEKIERWDGDYCWECGNTVAEELKSLLEGEKQ